MKLPEVFGKDIVKFLLEVCVIVGEGDPIAYVTFAILLLPSLFSLLPYIPPPNPTHNQTPPQHQQHKPMRLISFRQVIFRPKHSPVLFYRIPQNLCNFLQLMRLGNRQHAEIVGFGELLLLGGLGEGFDEVE